MKKNLIASTIMSIFLVLSGCTSEEVPSGQNQDTLPEQTPIIDESETAGASEADLAAYSGAFETLDESFCNKIKVNELREKCITGIADQRNLDEAIEKNDASLCQKISSEDKKAACTTQIEVQAELKRQESEELNNLRTDDARENEIVASGDHTQCAGLEQPQNVIDCEINILTNRAIQENDESWCSKATSSETVEQCKFGYQVSTGGGGETAPSPPPGI